MQRLTALEYEYHIGCAAEARKKIPVEAERRPMTRKVAMGVQNTGLPKPGRGLPKSFRTSQLT